MIRGFGAAAPSFFQLECDLAAFNPLERDESIMLKQSLFDIF